MGMFDFVGDFVGEFTGANRAADAAEGAAKAREAELRKAVALAEQGVEGAAEYAQMLQSLGSQYGGMAMDMINSPNQLRTLENAISNQERMIQKQEQLFANIDPALMEASEQTLALLQGKEAQSMDPIRRQREEQRNRLVDNLREQMGPGAETSTAGIQALNQFDQATDTILSNAQQSYLGQVFGMAQQGAQGRSALNQGSFALGGLAQAFGNARAQDIGNVLNVGQFEMGGVGNAANLEQGALGRLVNTQIGSASGAGSQFVGEQLRGQSQMGFTNTLLNAGINYGLGQAGIKYGEQPTPGALGGIK